MITIRPSNLKTFLECRRRWYLDITKPSTKSNEALVFGNNVHLMLEGYIENLFKPREARENSEDILNRLVLEFQKNMLDDCSKLAAMQDVPKSMSIDLKQTALSVLSNFRDALSENDKLDSNIFAKAKNGNSVALERYYETILTHNVKVAGTADIICFDNNGNAEIWDIKTMQRKRDIHEYLLQLSAYAWLLSRHKDVSITRLGVVKVVKNKKLSVELQCIEDKTFISFLIKSVDTLIKHIIETLEAFEKTGNKYLFNKNECHWTCSETYCAHYKDCIKK